MGFEAVHCARARRDDDAFDDSDSSLRLISVCRIGELFVLTATYIYGVNRIYH